jgi:hypothetical protein
MAHVPPCPRQAADGPAMTDCTERHVVAGVPGLAGEGQEGMAEEALP